MGMLDKYEVYSAAKVNEDGGGGFSGAYYQSLKKDREKRNNSNNSNHNQQTSEHNTELFPDVLNIFGKNATINDEIADYNMRKREALERQVMEYAAKRRQSEVVDTLKGASVISSEAEKDTAAVPKSAENIAGLEEITVTKPKTFFDKLTEKIAVENYKPNARAAVPAAGEPKKTEDSVKPAESDKTIEFVGVLENKVFAELYNELYNMLFSKLYSAIMAMAEEELSKVEPRIKSNKARTLALEDRIDELEFQLSLLKKEIRLLKGD